MFVLLFNWKQKNVEYLVGILGGGIAQETRRHYLANVFVIDNTRDGASGRGYFSLQNCSADIPDVTIQWLFESLIRNTLLPFSDFIFKNAHK